MGFDQGTHLRQRGDHCLARMSVRLRLYWSRYNGKKDVVFQPALMSAHELLMGMEWAARQFYSLSSITERMIRSRTGLWWNIARNLGYHLALRNFGEVGFNPEGEPEGKEAGDGEGAFAFTLDKGGSL